MAIGWRELQVFELDMPSGAQLLSGQAIAVTSSKMWLLYTTTDIDGALGAEATWLAAQEFSVEVDGTIAKVGTANVILEWDSGGWDVSISSALVHANLGLIAMEVAVGYSSGGDESSFYGYAPVTVDVDTADLVSKRPLPGLDETDEDTIYMVSHVTFAQGHAIGWRLDINGPSTGFNSWQRYESMWDLGPIDDLHQDGLLYRDEFSDYYYTAFPRVVQVDRDEGPASSTAFHSDGWSAIGGDNTIHIDSTDPVSAWIYHWTLSAGDLVPELLFDDELSGTGGSSFYLYTFQDSQDSNFWAIYSYGDEENNVVSCYVNTNGARVEVFDLGVYEFGDGGGYFNSDLNVLVWYEASHLRYTEILGTDYTLVSPHVATANAPLQGLRIGATAHALYLSGEAENNIGFEIVGEVAEAIVGTLGPTRARFVQG